MTHRPTLWVTGDSFSYSTPNYTDNINLWTNAVADQLGFNIQNLSLIGSCQDYSMQTIDANRHLITKDDQLLIVLTEPSRFWFFENLPSLTNSYVIDFEETVGDPELSKAAEYYIKYIQRPELDMQALAHRLGWLNNLIQIKGWRKAHIIIAFPMAIPGMDLYPNLLFSNDVLSRVSNMEFVDNFRPKNGIDTRHGHLCISNHKILATKIINAIRTDTGIDLSTGFLTSILSLDAIQNVKWAQEELCTEYVDLFFKMSPPERRWIDRFKVG